MVTLGGVSIPEFVVANMLVWLLAVSLPIFPPMYITGGSGLRGLVLPILTLIPVTSAYMIKTMRSAMTTTLAEEYIHMASLKGLGRRRIVWRHALPNALVPMVSVFALNMGWLVGGIVVVEIIFQYPGIGRLLLTGVNSQDVPVIQGAALGVGCVYILLNLLADIAVFLLDPRIRRRAV
jgi:peptide/nickel transport system permease protein